MLTQLHWEPAVCSFSSNCTEAVVWEILVSTSCCTQKMNRNNAGLSTHWGRAACAPDGKTDIFTPGCAHTHTCTQRYTLHRRGSDPVWHVYSFGRPRIWLSSMTCSHLYNQECLIGNIHPGHHLSDYLSINFPRLSVVPLTEQKIESLFLW